MNWFKEWLRRWLGTDCECCDYYGVCEESYIPPPKKSKRIGRIYFVQGFRDPVTHEFIGDDTNDGLSDLTPLRTITEAVNRCKANDIVQVANPDFDTKQTD